MRTCIRAPTFHHQHRLAHRDTPTRCSLDPGKREKCHKTAVTVMLLLFNRVTQMVSFTFMNKSIYQNRIKQ